MGRGTLIAVSTFDVLTEIADRIEADLDSVIAEMDHDMREIVSGYGADASFAAEASASNRANIRRYLTVARRAADPPPLHVPPEAFDFARTVVRRGIESDVVYQGYRKGQQTFWRRWMRVAEDVARSGDELAEVLNVSLDLLFGYVDAVLGRVITEVEREREQVRGGALARRAEAIRLLLDGAPLDVATASRRLDHDLRRHQTALVLWTDVAEPQHGALERTALAVARAVGARSPLTLAASSTVLWAWLASDGPLTGPDLGGGVPGAEPHVRVAIGPTLAGASGFRRSHEAVVAIQGLLARNPEGAPIATYDELEIASLAAQDEQRAGEFVARTLGPLAEETPSNARLRETLRIFLEEAENAPRTAARLHTHRNTILQRVARATDLLGHPPRERRLAVALALELRRRLGA